MIDRQATLARLQCLGSRDVLELRDIQKTIDFIQDNERFTARDNPAGHLTASAWVISEDHEFALLLHHKRLRRWLQPGGHIEDDRHLEAAAQREAEEETGLPVRLAQADIFDVDVHFIPAGKREPGHYHYDIRFLFYADPTLPLTGGEESHELAWIAVSDLLTHEETSIARMARKANSLGTTG